MKSKLIVLSAALMLVLAGCGGNNNQSFTPASSSEAVIEVTSVSLNKSTLTLVKGEHETLIATVSPEDAADKTVSWSATGDGVVSVDDGLVTALKAGQATVTATAGGKSASCTVTVTDVAPLENLSFSGEADKAVDTWVYWNDQGWCGSQVAVNTATKQGKVLTFDYSVTSGACDFGFQVFYKNPALAEGASYRFTAKINSQVAATAESGYFKVNGVPVALAVGDNNIAVKYLEGGNAASSCQIVVNTAMGNNRFVVSDYDWEGILDTPSAISVSDGTLTFVKPDGAVSYKVRYFDSGKNYLDEETVTDSPAALTKVSSLADGNYYLTMTAISDVDPKYDSRESDYVLFKIGGGEVVPAGGPKTNMEFKAENQLDLDTFAYWNDQNWCGSQVAVPQAYTEEGLVHIEYTASGNCAFGLQIFYKNSSLTYGTTYAVSFQMKVTTAGNYGIGSADDTQAVAAETWTNITYDHVEASDAASLKICVNSTIAASNTIELKGFAWVAK